jgi:uncharacterized coiled-coil protein SlyX
MKTRLRLGETRVSVDRRALIESCDLFGKNPILLEREYCVHSSVSNTVFVNFLSAIESGSIEVTAANGSDLFGLSVEFGFKGLFSKVAAFQGSESELQSRLCILEERSALRERDFLSLRSAVLGLSGLVERFSGLESRLAATEGSLSCLQSEVGGLSESVSKLEGRLCESVDRLKVTEQTLLQQKSDFGRLLSGVETTVPSFVYHRRGFSHPNDQRVFKVLVIGGSIDRWRRLKLIRQAESFVSAVRFEFEEADVESEISLPAGTDGILNCGCNVP